MRTKAWSYIRLSTMDQIADGRDGEARQLEAAAAYAKTHDLDLQPPLKDLGVSGFKGRHRKRGQLKLFFTMVEMGLVPAGSYFLVENCDRLSREEPLVALETFTAIINSGINVVTTDDGQLWNRAILAREPMRLMMWIMGTIRGNAESKRKSEMVSKAHAKRLAKMRAEGKALSGRVPCWLRKKAGGGYEVDPVKGATIERIFREYDEGEGATRIAKRLNEEGVEPLNDYKTRKTNGWHPSVVRSIATNRAVIGEHQQTRAEGEGEHQRRVPDGDPIPNFYPKAIKDEALFYRVGKIIRERQGSTPRGGGRHGTEFANLFHNISVCEHCGGGMHFRTRDATTKSVLQCGNASRRHKCHAKRRFDYATVEASILRFVTELDLSAESRSKAEIELDLLVARRDETQRKVSNLVDMAEDGGDPDILDRIRKRRAELNELDQQIGALHLAAKETASVRQLPRDHQEAVKAIMAEMATKTGDEAYALRTRLALSLRSVIVGVQFNGEAKGEESYTVRLISDQHDAAYLFNRAAVIKVSKNNGPLEIQVLAKAS